MFATSVRARRGPGTPASIAHGCGSPKIAPVPIWRRAVVPARVPAPPRPLARHDLAKLGRAPAKLRRERAVAAQVGQIGQARIGERELGGDQRGLGHLQQLRREVRPVAVRARQVPAVGSAQRLLVAVRDLHVRPHARPLAGVGERMPLAEEAHVARAEPVLGGREEQPEVEVAGGSERVEVPAQPDEAVRQVTARLGLHADREAQDLPREPRARRRPSAACSAASFASRGWRPSCTGSSRPA